MSATAAEAAPVGNRDTAPLLTFRPDVEGLRALAVGLVVLLHAGVTAVGGGFVGVDVFFVISGFLITSLLIDEVRRSRRVSILGFYARRARRILPASCVVIAVTVVVAKWQLGPIVGRTTAVDGQWAAEFAANFRLIHQGTDYFATNLPPSPLQHFWSLAVEEQFYLVWPTVLFGLVILGRRLARPLLVLQLGLGGIVAASLYWSIHLTSINATTAYFSPFTRAWELGIGAIVAVFSVTIARTPSSVRAAATWIGLVFIAIAAFAFTSKTVFPGYAALLPVAGTALVVAGGIGRPARSAGLLLGVRPMRELGKISFSVYLWHWPVLVIAEERASAPLDNVARVVCVLITLALSVVSFFLIERPMRASALLKPRHPQNNWERNRRALAFGAAAIALAVGVSAYTNNRAEAAINTTSKRVIAGTDTSLVIDPALSAPDQVVALQREVRALVERGLALRSVPPDLQTPVAKVSMNPKYIKCLQARGDVTVRPCTFGSTTSSRTLVAFGDSHAMTWMPALDKYGSAAGYRVVVAQKLACPIPAIPIFTAVGPYPQCPTWKAAAMEYIRKLRPQVVVVALNTAGTSPGGYTPSVWLAGLRTTILDLRKTGARVVEIGNNARAPQDPKLCLSRPGADPSTCTADYSWRAGPDVEGQVVTQAGGVYIDAEPWFCIDGRCPLIIDKRVVLDDYDHLAPQYVTDIEPLLAATLEANGLR